MTRAYYDCCRAAINSFDGIVANYIGDGVMALFGYPRAREDEAERAIQPPCELLGPIRAGSAVAR